MQAIIFAARFRIKSRFSFHCLKWTECPTATAVCSFSVMIFVNRWKVSVHQVCILFWNLSWNQEHFYSEHMFAHWQFYRFKGIVWECILVSSLFINNLSARSCPFRKKIARNAKEIKNLSWKIETGCILIMPKNCSEPPKNAKSHENLFKNHRGQNLPYGTKRVKLDSLY